MIVFFGSNKESEEVWGNTFCSFPQPFSCACQSQKQPIRLRLLGLCGASILRGSGSDRGLGIHFTPHQSSSDPRNLFFVSRRGILVEFSKTTEMWTISDAGSNFTAVTHASKSSYVLGKHTWTFFGDSKCTENEYALKLTSCSYSTQFTCNDGTCISMDGRCDHVTNCRDR